MRKLMVLVLSLLFVMTACTYPPPTPTSTPMPTPTPTLTPTPTPTPVLNQTYSAQLANGSINLDYPGNWSVNVEFPDLGVTLATSEDLAAEPFVGALDADQVYVEILFLPEGNLDEGATPDSVLQEIVDSIEEAAGTVSEIELLTLDGKDAAIVILDSEEGADGIQLVIDSGDAYSTIVAAVPDGQIEAQRSIIEEVAGSIVYDLDNDD